MPRRKRSLSSPPKAWAGSIDEHHYSLHAVRLLWRRGNVPYRPLVPSHLEIEQLSDRDFAEYELPETHFEWDLGQTESPADRQIRIAAIVDKLWSIAIEWTRSRGEWCDFQLAGYDEDGETLFEHGCRCRIDDGPESSDSSEDGPSPRRPWSPPTSPDQRPPVTISPEWRELHSATKVELGEVITHAKADRDRAVARERTMLEGLSGLWQQAHEASQHANQVLLEAVAHEREQARLARDDISGRAALQAKTIYEMEKTERVGKVLGFLKNSFEFAVGVAAPIVKQAVENMGRQGAPSSFPEFRVAQQAMAYLVISMTPPQLDLLFDKDREMAGAFLGRLDQGATMADERRALEHVAPIVKIIRSEHFRGIALPEQQLAGRFILHRLAMFKMVEFGEDD